MEENYGEADATITPLDHCPHRLGLYGNQTLVIGNFGENAEVRGYVLETTRK